MLKMKDFDFALTAIPADSDWGKCITSYLSQIFRKCESPSTHTQFRLTLQQFFSIEPRRLPHLYNREDVERLINAPGRANGRVGQPVKTPTINNRLSVLHCFYKYAATYGVQGSDGMMYPLMPYLPPTAGVRFAKYPHYTSTKAMTDDELRRFFAAIGTEGLRAKRDRALCLMYFWSARRRNEIIGLRWRDIEKTLIIDDKGSRTAWAYRWKGKGHASIDDIAEMPPIAAAALFEYLEESGRLATMEPDDYLYCCLPDYARGGGYDPKRPLVESQVGWIIQYYAKKAKLEHKISCHTFRHTSARIAYANGASIREVQQKLRHRNLATTSIYLETLIGVSDPTIDRLHQFANL